MKKTVAAQRIKLGVDGMFVIPDGEYYSASDYDKLKAKCKRLLAKNRRRKEAGDGLAKILGDKALLHMTLALHLRDEADGVLAEWKKVRK